MKKSEAWTVPGVDFYSKRLAEMAAQRSGLSVADWLADIIAEKASKSAISAPDEDEQDVEFKAIVARLDRLREKGAAPARRELPLAPVNYDAKTDLTSIERRIDGLAEAVEIILDLLEGRQNPTPPVETDRAISEQAKPPIRLKRMFG